MAAPDSVVRRALEIIDGDASEEEKHGALCDLEAYSGPGVVPVDRICHLVESMNSDVVEATLRLLAISVTETIPDPLLSPSFLLRLGWITASSMSASIAKEAADLLAAFLWQSTAMQEANGGGVVLAGLLSDALTCHQDDEVVSPCLHSLLRLLIASDDGAAIAESILSRKDVVGALLDAIVCSEYDSDRMPVLACSVLAQCLRLQTSLPEELRRTLKGRRFMVMRSLERIMSLCSPTFVLPVIGALISCGSWASAAEDPAHYVVAFVESVCLCLSLAIERSPDLIQDWVVPICFLVRPVINGACKASRRTHANEHAVILDRAKNFVDDVLDRYLSGME